MVYVEKYKVKGNTYFKLVHNIRKGKKVLHIRKYLGKKPSSKEKLAYLKKEFVRQMQSNRYKYLSPKDVEDIEAKKLNYKKETKRLSETEKENRLKEFIIRFTYDSSKLAGVAITLRQTSLILKEGVIPKGIRNLKTVKEIENHEKGVIAITKYRGLLNLNFIKKLHLILSSGIDDLIAGKLRY